MAARIGLRPIVYFIKGTAPDAQRALRLKNLAFQAIEEKNLDAKEVLIR